MYETATALLMSVQMLLPIFQILFLFLVIHHNTGKAHIKCQHLQVASQKLSVDSPDIFIQLPVFMKRKQNVFSLSSPARNSVRPWHKKKTIFGTICYSPPAPSPSDCWKLWTVSRTFLRTAKWGGASAPVLGQWRTEQPYHTYPRLANGEPLPGSHDMPFCALPLLSTLNPGECGHHWRPDTGGIGRPLSSSELTRRYLKQTLSPSDESWPSCPWEWPCIGGGRDFFPPSPNHRRGAGARQ